MRFERMDLNLLTALDALLETRSVSAAARRLHLSQPGVTAALRRLREFFGDELLVQSGRQMILTPRAEELAAPVRRVLLQIRAEVLTPAQFDPPTAQRSFAVVASDYAYTILFAEVMAEVARLAPGITFEILEPGTAAVEALERAEIDLLFSIAADRTTSQPSLALFRDDDVVIAWREAGYERMDRNAFVNAGHVVACFGPDRRPTLSDITLARDLPERRIEVVVPAFASLAQAVVGTQRLAVMHRLYAEHFAAAYPIAIYSSPVPLPEVVETVHWHEVRGRDPGIRWLLELITRHCAALPAPARPG